jgi:bifunctional DNA-binding transcriptional regulator/antitoxin component of YhaV-PrlF toxin-antitoxin module
MRITPKGQVTIPIDIILHAGMSPLTEIEFEVTKKGILIKKVNYKMSGRNAIKHMRGRLNTKCLLMKLHLCLENKDFITPLLLLFRGICPMVLS